MKQTKERRRTELYDSGCSALIEAIVRRAAEDYLAALRQLPGRRAAARVRETSAFFRSDYFRRLTGTDGERMLQMIRREVKKR